MITASLYYHIYIWGSFFLCLFYSFRIINLNNSQLLVKKNNFNEALLFAIILVIFLGSRPIGTIYFGDTNNYARAFNDIQINPQLALYNLFYNSSKDPLFQLLMIWFSSFTNVEVFFIFIEFIYITGNLWVCKKLFANNPYAIFLVVISSFSFYSYGVNGIRNGAALSIVLIALTFFNKRIRSQIIAVALLIIAYYFHRSTSLPSIMLIISFYFIRNFKIALSFWIVSILLSLFFGGSIASFFENLGFDDRFDSYLKGNEDSELMDSFSKSGFRWDFLLYSAVPILIGYYVIIVKRVKNKRYEFLLNTYALTNAFWIMIIRAAYSNRFAYLSWFMYPFVLAFPFLNINIWQNQSKKVVMLIMINILFTLII